MAGIIINGTFCALLFSEAPWIIKIGLFVSITGIVVLYSRRNLLGATPLVFLTILSLLFLPGVNSSVAYIWMAILGCLATLYTISFYVPAIFLLGIVVTLFVSMYVAMLTYTAYHALDRFAFTVYVCALYLVWYGWVRERPRLRHV